MIWAQKHCLVLEIDPTIRNLAGVSFNSPVAFVFGLGGGIRSSCPIFRASKGQDPMYQLYSWPLSPVLLKLTTNSCPFGMFRVFIVKHKDEHNLNSLKVNERYFYNPRAMNVRFRI